jgi:hypothetical protein
LVFNGKNGSFVATFKDFKAKKLNKKEKPFIFLTQEQISFLHF